MRIIVVSLYYEPEVTGIAPLTSQLCRHLVSRGHDVTAIVGFPHYPEWRRRGGDSRWRVRREQLAGVDVVRVPHYVPSRPKAIKRIAYDTSFGATAAALILRQRRPDVVMCVCSPIQSALAGWLAKIRWGVPFAFHLQDLLPESAREVGMIENGPIIRLAYSGTNFLYARADLISVIGRGFASALRARGISPSKLTYLPNWADTSLINPQVSGLGWRTTIGAAAEDFVVQYVGNIGYKQAMGVVVEAASKLSNESDTLVSIVGDGADRRNVDEVARRLQPPRLVLHGVQPRERLPEMLAASDLHVVHQAETVVEMVVPSKLLVYAASGRPVLFAGRPDSEGGRFVRESGCGVVIRPEDPDGFADAVRALRRDPRARQEMGENGRQFAVREFSADHVLQQAELMLTNLASGAPPSGSAV